WSSGRPIVEAGPPRGIAKPTIFTIGWFPVTWEAESRHSSPPGRAIIMATNRAHPRTLLVLASCGLALAWPGPVHGDFGLRDGDTVVFLGDSITAARTYGKIVENYTRLRFPDRMVRFINAGWGGDTMAGGLRRIQRDVFDRGATVLIVAYGVNDIGWGTK